MKFLFDLFPVIFFFAAYKYAENHRPEVASLLADHFGLASVSPAQAPILLATVAVIVAAGAQLVWAKLRHGRIDRMLLGSFAIVVVLGGLTLIFQDDIFIRWKPTILYWGLAGGMLFSSVVLHKNPMRAMLGNQVEMPDAAWRQFNGSLIGFLASMGVLNLVVAFFNPFCATPEACQAQWVDFKVFGITALTLVFFLIQGLLLYRHIEEK